MNMKELINKHGGNAEFSRKTGIPIRTVEDWKAGKRTPPPWVPKMIVRWLDGTK